MNNKAGTSKQTQTQNVEPEKAIQEPQKNPLEELIAYVKSLEERVKKLEIENTNFDNRIQNLEGLTKTLDVPVQIPERRNYNPDRMPIGPTPMGYAEFLKVQEKKKEG